MCVVVMCKSLVRICNSVNAQREYDDDNTAMSSSGQHTYWYSPKLDISMLIIHSSQNYVMREKSTKRLTYLKKC